MNKAAFLDKDGTINEDVGYLDDPNKLVLLPRAAEAIKRLNEHGFKVIIISNQSGIAKGILTEDILQTIDKKLQKELLKLGAYVDAIYYCPHHPEHGLYPYKKVCQCRKPHPGLVKRAEKEHNIDLKSSYFVGDKLSDIETGKAVGIKTILVLTGKGKETKQEQGFSENKPDYEAPDLFHAVNWIIEDRKNAE